MKVFVVPRLVNIEAFPCIGAGGYRLLKTLGTACLWCCRRGCGHVEGLDEFCWSGKECVFPFSLFLAVYEIDHMWRPYVVTGSLL